MTKAQQCVAVIEWSKDYVRARRNRLLNTMKWYNIRVLTDNGIVRVHMGNRLIYCVSAMDSEHDIKIRDTLHCIDNTVQVLYDSGQLLEC